MSNKHQPSFKIDAPTRERFHKYVELLTPIIHAAGPIKLMTKEKLTFEETFNTVRYHALQLALEPDADLWDSSKNIIGLDRFWCVQFEEQSSETEKEEIAIEVEETLGSDYVYEVTAVPENAWADKGSVFIPKTFMGRGHAESFVQREYAQYEAHGDSNLCPWIFTITAKPRRR